MVYHDDKKNDGVIRIPKITRTLFGGLGGMVATIIVHPLDLVKVRLQVFPHAKTTMAMAKRIILCEGIPALYTGLSAGLLRQATHTTARLGVYYWLYEEYRHIYGKFPALPEKMMMGAYAGLVGAFAGNPSEVALVRLMADGKRDPCNICGPRRRYRGVFDAIYKITCTEGLCALWRGGTLTLTRSVFVSLAQIGTYTQVRETLKERKLAEGTRLHLYTSVISSFFTACLTLPVDLVKTRYQYNLDGLNLTQREVFDGVVKKHGYKYLWKGFLPYFIRLSLHTVLTYIVLEELNAIYIANSLGPQEP